MKRFTRLSAALLCLSVLACAPKTQSVYSSPCRSMDAELKEKKSLDEQVKKVTKEARAYRKTGDTVSAASAETRLTGMLENQRLLKESLEQSSRDCSPTWQDPPPVRDPASRDIAPK